MSGGRAVTIKKTWNNRTLMHFFFFVGRIKCQCANISECDLWHGLAYFNSWQPVAVRKPSGGIQMYVEGSCHHPSGMTPVYRRRVKGAVSFYASSCKGRSTRHTPFSNPLSSSVQVFRDYPLCKTAFPFPVQPL